MKKKVKYKNGSNFDNCKNGKYIKKRKKEEWERKRGGENRGREDTKR